MGIPQVFMICLFAMDFAINLINDGEKKEGHYDVFATIVAIAAQILILKAGGFF